ncbi:MAG TPA: TetR/AcrR family transcriptional regulator [Candidatus Competibacteraceae bacterium]|nr:TetR/AcrR family transcriptional regulator [Candidatus Competibacteraceae bacterium]
MKKPGVSKGEHTRAAILEQAVAVASQLGLEGLTIGTLAQRTGLSKSGLFAHFGSKEELQLETLHAAQALFNTTVVQPARRASRGLSRLTEFFQRWLNWTVSAQLPGGCLFAAGATEFDDRPGPVREALANGLRQWRLTLIDTVRQAAQQGQLRADVDAEQFVFELYGILLAAHNDGRLLGDSRAGSHAERAFARLVSSSLPATAVPPNPTH